MKRDLTNIMSWVTLMTIVLIIFIASMATPLAPEKGERRMMMEYKSGKHKDSRNHGNMSTFLSFQEATAKLHILFL